MAKKSAAEQIAVKEETRAKALERFLAEQNKKNPGEVMRLSDDAAFSDVDAVSTGAISLDVALGCGGFPKGRIIEVFGPEMSGKCLAADTYVWSDHGLETIAELFERCGQSVSSTTRVTDISDLGVRLVNENGELEHVAALTHNGARKVLRVELESGRYVDGTGNHPLRVLNERGMIVWKNISDIEVGNVVVSAEFGAVEAGQGSYLTDDEAVLLGYLTAEGTLGQSRSFMFSNTDPEVSAEYLRVLRSVLGDDTPVAVYGGKDHATHSKALRTVLAEQYGLDYTKSAGKVVPHCVRTAGAKAQAAFLSALYEGDGWVDKGYQIGLTSASEDLVRDVQLLLYGLGIPASVRAKWNKKYERNYWNVLVGRGAADRFLDIVGFRSERRAAQVAERYRETTGVVNAETIPNLLTILADLRDIVGGDREFDRLYGDIRRAGHANCSREKLRKIIAWCDGKHLTAQARGIVAGLRELAESRYTFETVTSVVDRGIMPTFDVVVPGTHSFLANGVLSHNTSLALSVAANVQRAGGNVGFVDAEHALNRQHAIDMGVNPDTMMITQPGSGEKAIEMVLDMVKSGAFDMVIVDSVAAMTPQSEIDGDIDSERPGVHAKLMSRFMRLATGPCSENNTMLVLINQVRSSLSSYGNPEVTTGGKAIKFYASVRIEVRSAASKKIERNKQIVGQTCVATVRKNKVGPPHRVAEYDLYFGQGISGESSLLDVAEAMGLVVRSGASYTEVLTSLKLGVGKETVKQKLTDDDELRERLTKAVYDTLRNATATFEPEAETDEAPDEDDDLDAA